MRKIWNEWAMKKLVKTEATSVYTVEPGRNIYRDGQPFITIGKAGSTAPVVADEVTHVIASALNQIQPSFRYESRKHEAFDLTGTDFSAIERAALQRIKETYRLGEMDMNLVIDQIHKFWAGGVTLDDFRDRLFYQLGGGADVGNIVRELRDAGIL